MCVITIEFYVRKTLLTLWYHNLNERQHYVRPVSRQTAHGDMGSLRPRPAAFVIGCFMNKETTCLFHSRWRNSWLTYIAISILVLLCLILLIYIHQFITFIFQMHLYF